MVKAHKELSLILGNLNRHSSNTLSALCSDEPLSRICRCAKTFREGASENTYSKTYTVESLPTISDLIYPTYSEYNCFEEWYEDLDLTKRFDLDTLMT